MSDRIGSSSARSPLMAAIWIALAIGVLVEAVGEVLRLGGNQDNILFSNWLHDALMFAAALLILWRVSRYPDRDSRAGWAAIGVGYLVFAIGDVTWSLLYGRTGVEPDYATVPDFLYLAWYPFMFLGIGFLVRDRVPGFELNRWIDGVVVMLVVATPGIALVLQPVLERPSRTGPLGRLVDIAPAFGDVLLVGAILGVFGLMAWRPGRTWLVIGFSLALTAGADAVFAVQAVDGFYRQGVYDFIWTAGAVLMAYASWLPPPSKLEAREVFGWRAILLPVLAQGLGVATTIFAYFKEIPTTDRIVSIVVMVIATVQIVISRPRKSVLRPSSSFERGSPRAELQGAGPSAAHHR